MKIIANGITNLTDARYFAAMGVDWIGFDMGQNSPLSIEHVIAFADWVEGPRFFLDVRGRSEDQIAAMLGSFQAAALLTDRASALPHYAGKLISTFEKNDENNGDVDTAIFSFEMWQEKMNNKPSDEAEEVWVEIENVTEYQSMQISADMVSGIVVSGSDEQKTGVKSYDDLDELIELIRS